METYNPIKVEGTAFYKSIKSISFKPMRKIEEMKVAVPRGKWFFWKLFGLIPLIPKRAKEDLYKVGWGEALCRFQPIKRAHKLNYAYWDNFLNEKEKTVYHKAKVEVSCLNYNNNKTKYFTTNQEAKKYFDDVRNKCKDCGNDLK
jgi:hypothetical protein